MKFILLLLFSLSIYHVHGAGQTLIKGSIEEVSADTSKYSINFETRLIQWGKVKRGDKVSGSFRFTNTGTENIVIELVSSCECTTVEHSFSPIIPGEISTIDFVFDSSQKEESGTTDVDVYLKNIDPKTGEGILEILQYSYELVD